mgnify:FL=1
MAMIQRKTVKVPYRTRYNFAKEFTIRSFNTLIFKCEDVETPGLDLVYLSIDVFKDPDTGLNMAKIVEYYSGIPTVKNYIEYGAEDTYSHDSMKYFLFEIQKRCKEFSCDYGPEEKTAYLNSDTSGIQYTKIGKNKVDEDKVTVDEFDKAMEEGLDKMIEDAIIIDEEDLDEPLPRDEPVKVETTKKDGMVTVKIQRPKAVGLEGQLQDMVFSVLESDFTTQTIRNKMIELGLDPERKEIVVTNPKGKSTVMKDQHYLFEDVLMAISAKVNIALVGPAGSGKTTLVANIAKSLGLPFYSKSVSAQTGTHEFFGYQDANGKYVRTLFREAYENGGVFLLDEFDAGNPNVLASMNQATANGGCAFADGMIAKHADFTVVMAGNTFGHGATTEYVGRNAIDKATLDRFAFFTMNYDEDLEKNISSNKSWCKKVQALRKKATERKIKTIISPRATFMGERLLAVGMKMDRVMDTVIYKGLNEKEIKLLK